MLTVLPGVRDRADLARVLAYLDASDEERDYSVLGAMAPQSSAGSCVYCNHCQPCPEGIGIGMVNKFYDMAAQHYRDLEVHASACRQCGHCDARCPFGVEQGARMREIAVYFGE